MWLATQLNLAHVTENKKKKLKQTYKPTSVPWVRSKSKIGEGSPNGTIERKAFVKEMTFKSGVKGW